MFEENCFTSSGCLNISTLNIQTIEIMASNQLVKHVSSNNISHLSTFLLTFSQRGFSFVWIDKIKVIDFKVFSCVCVCVPWIVRMHMLNVMYFSYLHLMTIWWHIEFFIYQPLSPFARRLKHSYLHPWANRTKITA